MLKIEKTHLKKKHVHCHLLLALELLFVYLVNKALSRVVIEIEVVSEVEIYTTSDCGAYTIVNNDKS